MNASTKIQADNAHDNQGYRADFDRGQWFFEPEDADHGDQRRSNTRPDSVGHAYLYLSEREGEHKETNTIAQDHEPGRE